MSLKGANLITGAIILNGVACGMIYRPLEATRRKVDVADDKGREANVPRSVIFRKIIEDKRRRRTTSTGSLDGTMITGDNRVVRIEMTDSMTNSLHVIPEQTTENDDDNKVSSIHSVDFTTVYIADGHLSVLQNCLVLFMTIFIHQYGSKNK